MNVEEQAELERRRAADAERWLQDPFTVEFRRDLETQLAAARREVPLGNTEMHTKLIMLEQVMGKFFSSAELIVQTGKRAKLQLDELEQRRKSMRERLAMFTTMGRNSI